MKLALLAFVLSGFLAAQPAPLLISAGCLASCTPAPGFVRDQYFTGGTTQSVGGVGVYAQLRYGAAFSYDVPLANGFYSVTFDVAEPSQMAAGLRVFTITANGASTGPRDLFAQAGFNLPEQEVLQAMVLDGHLRIAATATVRTALINGIEIVPVAQTGVSLLSLNPDGTFQPLTLGPGLVLMNGQLSVLANTPTAQVIDWRTCCGGFAYLALRNPDGTDGGKYLAEPAWSQFLNDVAANPGAWTAVPVK